MSVPKNKLISIFVILMAFTAVAIPAVYLARERYDVLQNSHNSLQNSYDALTAINQDLSQETEKLETEYASLSENFDSLKLDYDVECFLRIGNSLESYYDYLRQELGPTGTEYWWQQPDPDYWQTSADFAANLALHDLRRIYWPSIEEDYYDAIGEYSYDTAYTKIRELLDLIDIATYDSATIKIDKILAFINAYIHYELEVNDVFLAPVETLGFKSDDCDDFSILAAALFDEVGIESAIGFFVNDLDQYHAMALVNVNELEGHRYYYYADLTHRGLDAGRWIIVEPQATIDEQYTPWVAQWELFAASEADA
jgi:hypothetical protein